MDKSENLNVTAKIYRLENGVLQEVVSKLSNIPYNSLSEKWSQRYSSPYWMNDERSEKVFSHLFRVAESSLITGPQ